MTYDQRLVHVQGVDLQQLKEKVGLVNTSKE